MDIYELSNANKPDFCDKHIDKPLDVFCRECKAKICLSCLIKDHYGHSVLEVREFLDEIRKQMSKELEKVSKYEREMTITKTLLGKYADMLLNGIDRTEKAVNEKAEELKQLIEQQRLLLVEELSTIKEKSLKDITKEREEMDKHSAEIASVRNLCNAIALIENPLEISRAMTEFRATSHKLAENHQVQMKRPLPSTEVLFHAEEAQSRKNIIGSIISGQTCVYY